METWKEFTSILQNTFSIKYQTLIRWFFGKVVLVLKRLFLFTFIIIFILMLFGCGSGTAPGPGPGSTPSPTPTPVPVDTQIGTKDSLGFYQIYTNDLYYCNKGLWMLLGPGTNGYNPMDSYPLEVQIKKYPVVRIMDLE